MIADRLDIKTGDLIDGKYKAVKNIGTGSYGDVFRVKDVRGNDYALKLLHLWDVQSEFRDELVQKFEQEYKTSQIVSNYLVHSIDYGTVKGNPYMVMEYCPKGDLDHVLKKDKELIMNAAHDILEGLHVLHSGGMVHRDLKPANVLIKANGTAALADFGTIGFSDVKRQSVKKNFFSTRPKDMKGTPLYMSPEIFERKGGGITYLPTVDIFSFGVMMYELLTDGSFPFGNIERIEELDSYQKNAKNGNWDVSKLNSAPYGRDWVNIIDRCLVPNYQERYQSAMEVLQDLKLIMVYDRKIHITEPDNRSLSISVLRVTQGDNLGAKYLLDHCIKDHRRMIRFGRGVNNDIMLQVSNSTYLSRYHFTLEKSKSGNYWIIRDGQWIKDEKRWVTSLNGTYINAKPVTKEGMKVYTGDIITAGEFKLKVE